MKRYLKEVYFEETPEDAIDVLVDLLYADVQIGGTYDIKEKAAQLRKEFESAKERDEAEYGQDIYKEAVPSDLTHIRKVNMNKGKIWCRRCDEDGKEALYDFEFESVHNLPGTCPECGSDDIFFQQLEWR